MDGEIGGFGALDDLAGHNASLSNAVDQINSIAHQSAGCDKLSGCIDRRNLMFAASSAI